MAEEKKNNNFDEVAYNKRLREVIRAYKPKKEISYTELTNQLVKPFGLDADQMDKLIGRIEDAGISVVDENGNPSEASLMAADKEAKEAKEDAEKEEEETASTVKINDPVRMYLNEIGRGNLLTADEEERRYIGNVVKEASSAFSTRLSDPYISVMEKAEDGEFCCEQLIRLNIEMLLISLIRSNKNKKPPAIKKNSTILAEITDYLSENAENKVTFRDVVKKFNLSPSVLKKIFREQVGCGVMDYFTRLKIDRAKEMIREEKYNFTEISERLEFNNSQYFTTVFKRVSGMTPSEYAKSVVSKSR